MNAPLDVNVSDVSCVNPTSENNLKYQLHIQPYDKIHSIQVVVDQPEYMES